MKTTIQMAREAAGDDWGLFQEYMPEIHRFAELVRAEERARIVAKQPAQQEPCCHAGIAHDCHAGPGCRIAERLKAYPQPAQRTWVGLTDEEVQTAWNNVIDGAVFTRRKIYKAIEAKLKEKNT